MTSDPVERFHVCEFIHEEMETRGWSCDDLVKASEAESPEDILSMELIASAAPDQFPNIKIDEETAKLLAMALGVSKESFLNLDRTYHKWTGGHRAKENSRPDDP